MLNTDTFKSLCMLAKTEKGKEIRKYYVKLEIITQKLIKEEMENKDNLLYEKEKELEKAQKQLEKVSKLKIRRWYDTEPGHTVYAYKSSETDSLITIGKTKNVAEREGGYLTHNQSGYMLHAKRCYNCDLTEKVLHHILDKYRVEKDKEWFDLPVDLAIYTINMVCSFLDNFILYSEELPNSKLLEYLDQSLVTVQSLSTETKTILNTNIELDEADEHSNVQINIQYEKDVEDFDKFVNDCCEVDKEYYSLTVEIQDAYRMWAGGMNLDRKKKLSKYIRERFKIDRKFYECYNSRMQIFVGIKVKPLIVNQENPDILPKYEEFVLTKCDHSYSHRISYLEFLEEYKKWIQSKYPLHTFTKEEKSQLNMYLNKHFLRAKMNNIKGNAGIWGLKLKSDDNTIIVKTRTKHRKQIVKIELETNKIVDTYDSLVLASQKLNIDYRLLSQNILNKKNFDNKFTFRYLQDL